MSLCDWSSKTQRVKKPAVWPSALQSWPANRHVSITVIKEHVCAYRSHACGRRMGAGRRATVSKRETERIDTLSACAKLFWHRNQGTVIRNRPSIPPATCWLKTRG